VAQLPLPLTFDKRFSFQNYVSEQAAFVSQSLIALFDETGEPLIGDQAFGVLLADDMCVNQQGAGVLAQMSELYNQFRCSIVAVMEVPDDQISAYGVISGDDMGNGRYRVDKMVEKPAPEDAPSNLAVIGRYILTPDIFDIIRGTAPGASGEIQITDALQQQANTGGVIAYKFEGRRFDCGSVPGFVEATNHVYETIYRP
jgi:UTP--glucose-1-phosphate uridylyltransferase